MNDPSTSLRAWAEQLLAAEAAGLFAPDAPVQEAVRVSEKLRISLTRFVGPDGFAALLRRALALARADVSSLQNVEITADGRFKEMKALAAGAEIDIEGATAITEHLLALLVDFVGRSLTFRLLRDAWPDTFAGIIREEELWKAKFYERSSHHSANTHWSART